jgi:hypothetical protein
LSFNKIQIYNDEDEGQLYTKNKKPSSFEEMLKYASELSKGLPFVRVDFYDIYGKCVFGELTLTPTSGNNYYITNDAQISLGKKINLSIVDKIRSEY